MIKTNNDFGFISRWWPTLLASLGAILGIILNINNLEDISWNLWIVIFFLIIQNLIHESNIPKLYIRNVGYDPKTFITQEQFSTVCIDVCSKRAVATDVFATVEWTDAKNQICFENTGRWFIPSEDLKKDVIGQQTVTIFPNGMPRRLHFGILNKDGFLCAWYRRPDGLCETHHLRPAPMEFSVKITLRSSNKGECTGYFLVKNPNAGELEIISTDKKNFFR
jgi:hypothetical protein